MTFPNPFQACGGRDHVRPASRREFLYVGLIGGLGLTLGDFMRSRAALGADAPAALKEGPAKACIHIFLPGGLSQHEAFDPKPNAPIEYRGPFGTTPTTIPGEVFSQHLRETGQIMDKITVIRSMTHGEAAHERGTHNMFTGYRPSPAIQFPSLGSVVSEEFGPRRNMPPYVCVPAMPNPYAGSGYLSSAYGPFSLAQTRRRETLPCATWPSPPALTPTASAVARACSTPLTAIFVRSKRPTRSRRWTPSINARTA